MITAKYFFFALLLIAALCLGAFSLGRWMTKPSATYVDTSRQSVIRQITSLNRLDTASFTIEKVIQAGTQGNQFQQVLYGDTILLIAHGTVVAGFDLSALGTNQARVDGTHLSLTLPPPTIFSTSLDNSQTKVFDRKLGLLSRGNQDLESQARQGAEATITQAACAGGILDQATVNARARLSELFTGLGFTQVTISIPKGSCDAG